MAHCGAYIIRVGVARAPSHVPEDEDEEEEEQRWWEVTFTSV